MSFAKKLDRAIADAQSKGQPPTDAVMELLKLSYSEKMETEAEGALNNEAQWHSACLNFKEIWLAMVNAL
jgi:hypothetical protein